MEPKKVLDAMRTALGGGEATALSEISHGEGGPDPFRVLIGTILSHRTRDEKTAEASERLFSRFAGVDELAAARQEDVMREIRGVGFYNAKSRNVIAVARIIRDQYAGRVPDSMEELLKLPAVGRKTANCVLVYGFQRDAIPVDTHVHRISNRLGIVHAKNPDETEVGLMRFFPRSSWLEVNDLFVRFGKSICRPVGPRCNACPLSGECEYCNNKTRKK